MAKTTLSTLRDLLEREGLKPVLLESSPGLPFAHLQIPLGKDFKDRNLNFVLWLDTQTGKNPVTLLQLIFLFPFNYIDDALPSTARYLHMINKTIAFPGFGLSEPDHAIYYKYAFPLPEGASLSQLMTSFIGLIEFFYDTYAPHIEEIASGQKSFAEIVRV